MAQLARPVTETEQARINDIVARLRHSVSALQVVNWLHNFYPYEWDKALRVLETIKYYSSDEMLDEYNACLNKLLDETPLSKAIFVLGSSKPGKSSWPMLYLVGKTSCVRKKNSRIQVLYTLGDLQAQGLKDGDILVLVDDFIGTAGTALNFYNERLREHLLNDSPNIKLVFLCVAYLEGADQFIKKHIPNSTVIGSPHSKVFSSRGSPFGYRPKMIPIRHFCYKYAEKRKLFINWDSKKNKRISHPLGFERSQALIVFEHTVPNNTLPIIWSSKNNWIPLYPRVGDDRIKQSKAIKQEGRYWISVARKLNLIDFSEVEPKSVYSRLNYQMLSVLRMKKTGAQVPKILQSLGIGNSTFKDIIQEGIQKGIFTPQGEITEKGDEVYTKIVRNARSLMRESRSSPVDITKQALGGYVPKRFLGRT